MKIAAISTLAALMFLTACAQKNDTPEAVRQGVIRDISKSFNVANMDVSVDAVSFRDKEADATVTFTLKGGSKDQGMTMKYVMERHDDNQWYIKSRAGQGVVSGAGPSTGAVAMPAGHPGMGGAGAMEGANAASGASKLNLPPGHPDLNQ